MSRIVIRTDAGSVPEIGTGHVIRTIKLADALRRSEVFQRFEILFVARNSAPYQIGEALIRKAGYRILSHPELQPNSNTELQCIRDLKPKILIFDRLETTANLINNLKKDNIFIVTFDDLGSGQPYADLAIHPLLHSVEQKPNVFIGYDYLLSTADDATFLKTKQNVSKVFVSFGGFDHRQLTTFFLNTIPKINGPNQYEIFTSGLDPKIFRNIVKIANPIKVVHKIEIVIHNRPSDYYKKLCESDLAIVSGGLTAFDCVHAGIPTIGIPQYEHQLENLKKLEGYGCLKIGSRDMKLDPELLSELVTSLCFDYKKRMAMGQSGQKLIDGKGLARTIKLMERYYLGNDALV